MAGHQGRNRRAGRRHHHIIIRAPLPCSRELVHHSFLLFCDLRHIASGRLLLLQPLVLPPPKLLLRAGGILPGSRHLLLGSLQLPLSCPKLQLQGPCLCSRTTLPQHRGLARGGGGTGWAAGEALGGQQGSRERGSLGIFTRTQCCCQGGHLVKRLGGHHNVFVGPRRGCMRGGMAWNTGDGDRH